MCIFELRRCHHLSLEECRVITALISCTCWQPNNRKAVKGSAKLGDASIVFMTDMNFQLPLDLLLLQTRCLQLNPLILLVIISQLHLLSEHDIIIITSRTKLYLIPPYAIFNEFFWVSTLVKWVAHFTILHLAW